MSGIFNKTKTVNAGLVCTAGAYSSGDVVGGLLSFAVSSAGGGGVIRRVMLVDDDNDGNIFTLYFFDTVPTTTFADNDPYAPVVADLKKQIGSVSIVAADYSTQNSNKIVIKDGDDLNIDYNITGEKVYAYLVCGEAITKTAITDLDLRVTFWQD